MTDQEKEKWIEDNQEAWNAFVQFSIQVAKTGKRFGFKLVSERVRWQTYFSKTNSSFKWNNSVTTYAGKKFLSIYPQYKNQVTIKGFKEEGTVK